MINYFKLAGITVFSSLGGLCLSVFTQLADATYCGLKVT